MMNELFLIIGGNLDNRLQLIQQAQQYIALQVGDILNASSIYETDAWGGISQPAFLNQVLQVQTHLTPHQVLSVIQSIELKLGRVRNQKYGARTMDIDIIFYGNAIINDPVLIVPHPHLAVRNFVLVPLAEIAANFLHPITHNSIQHLLDLCPDRLDVRKFIP